MECDRCGEPLEEGREFEDICDDCAIIEGLEVDSDLDEICIIEDIELGGKSVYGTRGGEIVYYRHILPKGWEGV